VLPDPATFVEMIAVQCFVMKLSILACAGPEVGVHVDRVERWDAVDRVAQVLRLPRRGVQVDAGLLEVGDGLLQRGGERRAHLVAHLVQLLQRALRRRGVVVEFGRGRRQGVGGELPGGGGLPQQRLLELQPGPRHVVGAGARRLVRVVQVRLDVGEVVLRVRHRVLRIPVGERRVGGRQRLVVLVDHGLRDAVDGALGQALLVGQVLLRVRRAYEALRLGAVGPVVLDLLGQVVGRGADVVCACCSGDIAAY
jgi:hypothetical protein